MPGKLEWGNRTAVRATILCQGCLIDSPPPSSYITLSNIFSLDNCFWHDLKLLLIKNICSILTAQYGSIPSYVRGREKLMKSWVDTVQWWARNISRPQFPRSVSDKCSISCLPPVQMTRSCPHWPNQANYTNQTRPGASVEDRGDTHPDNKNLVVYVCCLARHSMHYCGTTKHDMFTEGQCRDVLVVTSSPVTRPSSLQQTPPTLIS